MSPKAKDSALVKLKSHSIKSSDCEASKQVGMQHPEENETYTSL